MHVSLTRVSTSDQPIENATIVGAEMLRWFRESEGFEGLLMLSKEGTTDPCAHILGEPRRR